MRRRHAGGARTSVQRISKYWRTEPMDLSGDALVWASLVRIGQNRHVVQFVFHHIIADGWSIRIFIDEFEQFYRAFAEGRTVALPPLEFQYADFAAWQLGRKGRHKGLEYWKDHSPAYLRRLAFPSRVPGRRGKDTKADVALWDCQHLSRSARTRAPAGHAVHGASHRLQRSPASS